MHLNKAVVIGTITTAGPKLTYPEKLGGHPTCTFWLHVDEPGKDGAVYSSYIPVELTGKHAEAALASEDPSADRATLHAGADAIGHSDSTMRQLEKAGGWLLEASAAEIAALPSEEQVKLRQGLRMVLEVLACTGHGHTPRGET